MFSLELRERRKKAQISLREATKRMRGALSFSMLHRYERGIGIGEMSLRHARAISKLYKWGMADITKKIAAEVKKAKREAECASTVK